MPARLLNKVAVITGAGSGIGRALAKELAASGCHLALADIDESGLAETEGLLPASSRVSRHRLDVSDRDGVRSFATQVVAAHQQVDIVINNAGIIRLHSMEQGTYEDYEVITNVNVWGVLHGCKEFLPYLKERPEAWLVNMSSGAGIGAFENSSSYALSKFAVRGLTESLSHELRNTNVVVTCVFPGGVNTRIHESCTYTEDAARTADHLKQIIRRMSPERAAKVIVDGILKKNRRILVGRDARLLDVVVRLLPSWYQRILG